MEKLEDLGSIDGERKFRRHLFIGVLPSAFMTCGAWLSLSAYQTIGLAGTKEQVMAWGAAAGTAGLLLGSFRYRRSLAPVLIALLVSGFGAVGIFFVSAYIVSGGIQYFGGPLFLLAGPILVGLRQLTEAARLILSNNYSRTS